MESLEPSRRWVPRISLLSLLLLTGMIASWITTVNLRREVGPLRQENRRLRLQVGELGIDDPAVLQAIGVETYVTKSWKWRVWVPEGRRLAVYVAVESVPKPGMPEIDFPRSAGRLEINRRNSEGAEVEVALAAERTLDGAVRWILREGDASAYVTVPPAASDWLLGRFMGSSGGGRVGVQVKEAPGSPLVLVQKRVYYERGQIPPPGAAPTGDGVMAWIDAYE